MTSDITGNLHRPAGTPTGGQFAGRVHTPPKPLTPTAPSSSSVDRFCSHHGGEWGTEPTCTNCADGHGQPVPYPFPPLRDGLGPHEVEIDLNWVPNPEGPSIANPAGGVWRMALARIVYDGHGISNPGTNTPLATVNVPRPPTGTIPSGLWWTLDVAPDWVRHHVVELLAEPTEEDRRATAGIGALERQERELGGRPFRAAND